MSSNEIVDILKKKKKRKKMAVSCAVLESDKIYYRRTFIICSKNGTFIFEDSCLNMP